VLSRTASFTRGTVGGFAAVFLWSTTFALARSLSEQVGAMTAAASVYLCGGGLGLLLCWMLPGGLPNPRLLPPRYLFGCGSLFALYTVFIYLAVGMAGDRGELLEIALLNYLWPAATIVLSLPLLGQRAHPVLWPATGVAFAGVFLVMTQGSGVSWASLRSHLEGNPAAYALAFAGAIVWALYSNLARRWSTPSSEGAAVLFVPITGLLLLGIRCFLTEPTVWSFSAVVEAGALGSVTALAYALWDTAMRKGDHVLVVAASYFTPLLSTLFSCAYLGVAPGPGLWLGCLMIVGGSLGSWRAIRTGSRAMG
jgi:drug/metabolite transporter (DMT)-like permease